MSARNRKILLLLTLAGVVGLAVFAPPPDSPVGASTLTSPARNAKGADALPARAAAKDVSRAGVLVELPERGTLSDSKADLFSRQSWQPPPPKVVVAPPLRPPPPPMTYRFAGRFLQDGNSRIFVSKGDTPVAVKPGDTLDGGYVVESISTTAIALVYPPLGHKASISITPAEGSAPSSNTPLSALGSIPVQGVVNQPASSTQPQRDVSASAAAVSKPNGRLARVQWEGPAQIKMGASFSVALRVETDQPISSSPMQVRFDPTILESLAVLPGKRFVADAGRGFNYRTNLDGSIFVSASSKSVSVVGDSELLVLTFKPIKPGAQAEVRLTALSLQGSAGRLVAHEIPKVFRAPVTP